MIKRLSVCSMLLLFAAGCPDSAYCGEAKRSVETMGFGELVDAVRNSSFSWDAHTSGYVVAVDNEAKELLRRIRKARKELRGPDWLEQREKMASLLLAVLKDADAFIAAHVLLTDLFGVDNRRWVGKNDVWSGFYNGLVVRIRFKFAAGKWVKSIEIPQRELQHSGIKRQWSIFWTLEIPDQDQGTSRRSED